MGNQRRVHDCPERTDHPPCIAECGSGRQNRDHPPGDEHSYHLWRAAPPGGRGGGLAGGVRRSARRPRRHGARQRVADHRLFLAASIAGTAAPLNPAYKEDEFQFYLEDTNARLLLLPPEERGRGSTRGRRFACVFLTIDMDEAGMVSLAGVGRGTLSSALGRRCGADSAHQRQHGRPKRVPLSHANLSISAGNLRAATHSAPTMCRCV